MQLRWKIYLYASDYINSSDIDNVSFETLQKTSQKESYSFHPPIDVINLHQYCMKHGFNKFLHIWLYMDVTYGGTTESYFYSLIKHSVDSRRIDEAIEDFVVGETFQRLRMGSFSRILYPFEENNDRAIAKWVAFALYRLHIILCLLEFSTYTFLSKEIMQKIRQLFNPLREHFYF